MNAGNDSNPFKDQTVQFDQVSSSFHPFASSSRIELFSQESDLKNWKLTKVKQITSFTEWRTVCDAAFTPRQNNLHQCARAVTRIEIPPEGIRMSDAFPSRTAFLLFLFFYFLSPPPKQLLSSERSLAMKRQHIETTLTLIWRHDSALLEDFSVFWTTFFSHLCRQSALTSVFWLTLFPFPRLTVCLCTVRRLCKHIEPLPLCALHLIFIWSMKADGMPSSQTPCVKPVVSLLKICSVGRPDLTESHSKPEMQIVDTPLLASLSVCFLFFIIIILIHKRKEALQQAAFNMSRRSNIYPCRIQLRFSPFFLFSLSFTQSLETAFILVS